MPQDLAPPASRGDPRPLPPTGEGASSPIEELDAPPGPGVGGGLWTEGGTTFREKQRAFPHPPDHKVSVEGLPGLLSFQTQQRMLPRAVEGKQGTEEEAVSLGFLEREGGAAPGDPIQRTRMLPLPAPSFLQSLGPLDGVLVSPSWT